jgi:short-chain fatty acids transporter
MASQDNPTLIQRFGARSAEIIEYWMPNPFLFALILSYVVFIGGVIIQGTGPIQMVQYWYQGFWSLLTFMMQMVLILVTGYVVAYHPSVRRGLKWLTERPQSGAQAIVMVGVIAMVVSWVQWGLGLIIGAVLAREMGRTANERNLSVHYPLLCVAGYMGMGLTWHWGLSSSAALLINTPDNVFLEQGILTKLVPTTETIFTTYALALTVLGIIYAAVCLYLLSPTESRSVGITEFIPEHQLEGSSTAAADGGASEEEPSTTPVESNGDESTIGDRLNNSQLIGGIIALTGVAMTISVFATQGLSALNLNVVNFAFMFIGLVLFTRPEAYQDQFYDAITATGGIVLQFPFYAGIMGMMNSSGLTTTIADAILQLSTPETLPMIAWITAGIVNIFVPSGGGEFTVIGPAVLNAAQRLGVPVGQATIAYAVGDAHTNLFQPFWALPLLGITGMRARDMFGYAVTMLVLLIPFLAIALTVIPYSA